MKRLVGALLLCASTALSQVNGWAEIQNGWGEIQTPPGYSTIPAPSGCAATNVMFFGTPVTVGPQCDAGLTYDAATDTLVMGTAAGEAAIKMAYPESTSSLYLVKSQITSAGRGPFTIGFGNSTFTGVQDPVMGWGYNQTLGGTLLLAGEPGLNWHIEANYNDLSGANKMEAYAQYVAEDATTSIRPFFFQINRTTKRVTEMDFVSPLFIFGDGIQGATVDVAKIQRNFFKLYSPNAATTTLEVQAAAGQSAQLNIWYGGASALGISTSSARVANFTVGAYNPLQLWGESWGTGIAVGGVPYENSMVGLFAVGAGGANQKGIVSRGRSGQTGNLIEVQDSASVLRWAVDPAGNTLGSKSKTITDGAATAFATFTIADGATYGGKILYSVVSTQGTAKQRLDGELRFSATREGSTYTAVAGTTHEALEQTLAAAAGTLTGGVTIACTAGVCTLSATFDTSQTPDTFVINARFDSPDAGMVLTFP